MAKILVTGISSGIGRELTKRLTAENNTVFGVSRRILLLKSLKKEIEKPSNLKFATLDLSAIGAEKKLLTALKKEKFVPSIVIFNAAILENDLSPKFDTETTRKMFAVNFFSVLETIKCLLNYVPRNTQFIAISSVSALRGSSVEGFGYAASKAALSIMFEAFHQKYLHKNLIFTTIYLGPVKGGMSPFHSKAPFQLTIEKVTELVIRAIKEKGSAYYSPFILFLGFRLMRLLPPRIVSNILAAIEKIHKNNAH